MSRSILYPSTPSNKINYTKKMFFKELRCDKYGVLTNELAEQLRALLPNNIENSMSWRLVYSLHDHGSSFATLFDKSSKIKEPCILAIKDSSDNIFGAYLSEPPCIKKGYYGNGSCFLWRLYQHSTSVYYSTGLNEYYILSEPGAYLAFGKWF
jgi:hypothetical protein